MDIRLNGETTLFPIIGDPIGQVKSPEHLTRIMNARGINAMVVPAHVAPRDVPVFMAAAAIMRNVGGVLATVPHKVAALSHCDEASERARFAGSCNVLRRRTEGGWRGDNTDGQGYVDGMAREGFDIAGKRALLVGVGGAGSAIAYEMLARGAAYLAISEIDAVKRDDIVARLAARFPGRVGAGHRDPRGFDLVANATPLGMRAGDPYPVDVDHLVSGQFVADAITRPEISPMLERARALGCRTMPGFGMFAAQAEILVDFLCS